MGRGIKKLSGFATSQPHTAYAAFTHGLSSKWNYLLRITDWEAISDTDLLQPIETAIRTQLIPALTGHSPPSDLVRELMALPTSLGGLGLINPQGSATEQNETSKRISAPLVDLILQQNHQLLECHSTQKDIKDTIRAEKRTKQKDAAKTLQNQLPPSLQRCMELSQKELQHGCQHYLLTSMDLPSTNQPLGMLCLFDMIGLSLTHPHTVAAGTLLVSSMLYHALREGTHQLDIMKSETSLPRSCPKSVTEW